MTLFGHLYLVCYAVYKILRIHFLQTIFIPIYILEILCLNTGLHNCTVDHLPLFYFFIFIL